MNPDEYETPVNCDDCCCGPDCELLTEMAPSGSDAETVTVSRAEFERLTAPASASAIDRAALRLQCVHAYGRGTDQAAVDAARTWWATMPEEDRETWRRIARAVAADLAGVPLGPEAVREAAERTRQIEELRGVVSGLQVQVGALQALNAGTTEDAQAEAAAIIYGWGPRFHAILSWELELDADAQIALEAWEKLVLQMCTARAEQLRAQS